jgi:hypothetical protein
MEQLRRYMNFAQCAEYLNTTPDSLRVNYKRLGVPYAKMGARVVFDRFDLDRYVESKKVPSTAA